MNIYHLKLIPNKIPVTYDYYSSTIVSASSEEEARNMVNKNLFQGCERNFDLKRIKEHYISFDVMKEKFEKHGQELNHDLYQELMASDYGFVEDNEIWKNPEYTEIVEIGSSHSTEPEVHTSTYHAG